jgi:nitrate/TMAO reductase-like tetraheme cytochrome c subunit
MMKLRERLNRIFPNGFPRRLVVVSLVVLGVLGGLLLLGGNYAWEYANSPKFCGYTCHLMTPQNTTYKVSPHSNVYCSDCHIGRASFTQQFARKAQDLREVYAMVFSTYENPLHATHQRPASETCEKCHRPDTFSFNSLRTIRSYANDRANTPTDTYLVLKTGGGVKSAGQGQGIHWHIVNKVVFYAADPFEQDIPYVRVYNDDGTTTEYVDVEANFDKSSIKEDDLVEVDCMICHNRVSHHYLAPEDAVDNYLARGLLNVNLPDIRRKAVEVLSVEYPDKAYALEAIAGLTNYYQQYYPDEKSDTVQAAVKTVQEIYANNFFPEYEIDWKTYPQNIGHTLSAGCFRCHDGSHLNEKQEAIRLECNLCHSIPVVAGTQDFVAKIEISRGPEPDLHRNPNWISLHNQAIDSTCQTCHTTDDPGGTSNTSFCSNSACHSSVMTYAGFNAPALREALAPQVPTPMPTPTPLPPMAEGAPPPTYITDILPIFTTRCASCHGDAAMAGLNLTTYEAAMKGGKDGAVILPGDSANSKLVQIQEGQHFGQLTADELKLVKLWIDGGAMEK